MRKAGLPQISLLVAALFGTATVLAQPRDERLGNDDNAGVFHDNDRATQRDRDDDAIAGRNDTLADVDEDDVQDAQEQVMESVSVVNQLKSDAKAAGFLERARGVFILPDYAKAGLVVGGEGGEGVVLLREDRGIGGEWTPPAFFNIGGVSVGATAGVKAGSVVMFLMSDAAVEPFLNQDNNFSLDANAGITIVNYSAAGEASAGKEDVVIWSETEGAFVSADIGITDIKRDDEDAKAYYGRDVSVQQILSGNFSTDRGDQLRQALSGPATAANIERDGLLDDDND